MELEQKGEGLLPVYTDLVNPDFGKVAEAMGLWGKTVSKAEDLEGAVAEWLGQPGPALLNVKVEPMELVMPPHTAPENVYGMAMYSIKAVMHGKAGDVFEMIGENHLSEGPNRCRGGEPDTHLSRLRHRVSCDSLTPGRCGPLPAL